jgi:hypothetical protein
VVIDTKAEGNSSLNPLVSSKIEGRPEKLKYNFKLYLSFFLPSFFSPLFIKREGIKG